MTIPAWALGPGGVILGLLLTFIFPIQRGRMWNTLWDLVTLGLFVAGAVIIDYWDPVSNWTVGLIAGVVAVLLRDFRLWKVRFQNRVYRAYSPRYWYGRAYGWYNNRRGGRRY